MMLKKIITAVFIAQIINSYPLFSEIPAGLVFAEEYPARSIYEFSARLRNNPALQAYKLKDVRLSDYKPAYTVVKDLYVLILPNTKQAAGYVTNDFKYMKDRNGWRAIEATTISNHVSISKQQQLDRDYVLSKITLKGALCYQYGNGDRKYIVFSAIDCRYSKRLEALLKENEKNSHYNATLFVFPTALTVRNNYQVRNIWCSNSPAQLWRQALTEKVHINNIDTRYCDYNGMSAKRSELMRILGITAYPAIVSLDGTIKYQGLPSSNSDQQQLLDKWLMR